MNMSLLLEHPDGTQWEAVRDRVKSHPQEIGVCDQYGLTNLHKACRQLDEIPLDLLELMLRQDQLYCEKVGQDYQLCACRPIANYIVGSGTPLSLYSILFGTYLGEKYLNALKLFARYAPECLLCPVEDGTVLHSLIAAIPCRLSICAKDKCEQRCRLLGEICLVLVQAEPRLLTFSKYPDGSLAPKKTPFHFALRSSRYITLDVLEMLLPARRDGGNLLHRFVSFPDVDHRDLNRLLLRAEMKNLLIGTDDENNTPLHVALKGMRLGMVGRLLSKSQVAVRMVNVHGQFPLDLVLGTRHIHVIYRLLYWYPVALAKHQLSDGLYAWIFKRLQPTTIFELLLSRPTLVRTLVKGKQQTEPV